MARVVTAIDVGRDAVKLVSVADARGMPELAGVACEPLEELGRIEEGPEKLAALKMRLSKLGRSSRLLRGETVIPVSGRGTFVRYIRVPPIPPWRLDALMRFEAMQQSGARAEGPADEARAYDFRMLDVPDMEGQSVVLLVLSQEGAVRDRLELARAAGAEDPDVELASLGLFNAYLYGHGTEEDEDKTVVLVDVGADEVNICIVRNAGLDFARHQRGGGRAFTNAVRKARGISWAEAEDYKRSAVRVSGDPAAVPSDEERQRAEAIARARTSVRSGRLWPEEEKVVAEAVSREAAELVRSIEAALMYARAQTKRRDLKVDRILLSGGGARLRGLAEFLAGRLKVEVSPLEPLRRISLGRMSPRDIEPLEGEYTSFAVPLGLALSRLESAAPKLDLRTSADKAERVFRQRGLYLRAAAAVFVAGMVFWIAGAVRDRIVYARAADAAQDRDKSDKVELRRLDAVRGNNERLQAEIGAMRERVTSGEDLLRALSQLKKRTKGYVRLIAVSTTRPKELPKEIEGEDPLDKEIAFAGRRRIYLHGYARSRESLADAFRKATAYKNSLEEAEELFEAVKPELLREATQEGKTGPELAEFIIAIRIARAR
ncbi:MAG: pilus assembly protein PilM [Planctomycetota bacterium]